MARLNDERVARTSYVECVVSDFVSDRIRDRRGVLRRALFTLQSNTRAATYAAYIRASSGPVIRGGRPPSAPTSQACFLVEAEYKPGMDVLHIDDVPKKRLQSMLRAQLAIEYLVKLVAHCCFQPSL